MYVSHEVAVLYSDCTTDKNLHVFVVIPLLLQLKDMHNLFYVVEKSSQNSNSTKCVL